MTITDLIQSAVITAVKELYGETIPADQAMPTVTRKEFEGDFTIVTFPFTRFAKKKPGEIAEELGGHLVRQVPQLARFNVVQGFLNLVVSDGFWTDFLAQVVDNHDFGRHAPNGQKMMVEYCSPNTNKPLHLGHVRNILLGWSCAQICEAAGYEVVKVQVINDRGIAICKSMLAWQKFAAGKTPASEGVKSDHFVGDWYVLFEQKFQEEYRDWQASATGQQMLGEKRKADQSADQFFKDFKNTYFNEHSPIGREARNMLLRWEAGDPATKELWRQMNQWVYDGFAATYKALGVHFDKSYYESQTYLLGKDIVDQGLAAGVFYKKEDGSVWADLTDAKLDHKVVMRSDGTSVYITQDLGTAQMRYQDFGSDKVVYVVGDEQNYHFQVLFELLKRLGEPYAAGLHHLSYGMVDLPTGKMKSREGTVVDADDLISEVINEAREAAKERGEITELAKAEQEDILRKIGLAALKFHIIKVGPQKRMVFDPKESVDLQGQTGPHIQYAYVRIKSVLRKAGLPPAPSKGGGAGHGESAHGQELSNLAGPNSPSFGGGAGHGESAHGQELSNLAGPNSPSFGGGRGEALAPQERELIAQLYRFPATVQIAAANYDPSEIASYCYDLAKAFHKFFTDLSILKAETEAAKIFRLQLCATVANTLKTGMGLLGIDMPERM